MAWPSPTQEGDFSRFNDIFHVIADHYPVSL